MRRTLLVLGAVALLVTACGDDEPQTAGPSSPETVTVTETVTSSALAEETPTGDASEPAPASADVCDELGEEAESLAFAFVTSPTVGTAVDPGFEASGCSNLFEATYQWELLDRDGEVLVEGHGTAECGTGCVGDFAFTVDYTVDQAQVGTLRVFATSPEDGSETDVNAIPLRLNP